MSNHFVSLIRAEQFYTPEAAQQINFATLTLERVQTEYGQELHGLQLLQPGLDEIFSSILGQEVQIDESSSGVIRTPMRKIHFESFDSLNDWCFAVALEPSTFNTYFHLSGADSALQAFQFNYNNLFEWDYNTNILLKPGQGIFFRPWLFHSFDQGNVVYFKLKGLQSNTDRKFRILVMGRSPRRHEIASLIANDLSASLISSSTIRQQFNDRDYSFQGFVKHSQRVRKISSAAPSSIVVIDSSCPTQQSRDFINSDFIIHVDPNVASKYDELNSLFEPPSAHLEVDGDFDLSTLRSILDEALPRSN